MTVLHTELTIWIHFCPAPKMQDCVPLSLITYPHQIQAFNYSQPKLPAFPLPLLIIESFEFAHGNFNAWDQVFYPICQNLWFSLLKTQFEVFLLGLLITFDSGGIGFCLC